MRLQISDADVGYGGDPIIKDVRFEIHDEQKVAIVGRNGCGKTTLLKLITGELSPVIRAGSNTPPQVIRTGDPVIASLSQMTFGADSVTLGDELRSVFAPLLEVKAQMEEALAALEAQSDGVEGVDAQGAAGAGAKGGVEGVDAQGAAGAGASDAPDAVESWAARYAALEERFAYLGGYRYEKDYAQLLRRFGFTPEDEARPLSDYSGGQRTKIAFIKLLLARPDILVLDEPTNHLDISTIAWLEGYLKEYPRALIVVSHDRLFLDRVADTVYEIERGVMRRYPGNYSDYVQRKREDHEKQQRDYEAQQREIARLQQVADRFIHKATKASMARSKRKAIERIEEQGLIERPESADIKAFHTLTEPARESGHDVLQAEKLGVGYDSVLATVTLDVKRGQKIGILGGNGLGKSTFLKTIAGKLPKRSGRYSYGHGVEAGYFDQQMAQYVSEKTVLDDFWDAYPALTETEARNVLGGFLFTGDDVYAPVSVLSGGERVRLALAKLFQTRPNLLLLDEPTNHMDIVGKEALEAMLRDYQGTLLFVSHDRYLIRQIADALLVFDETGAHYHPYGYEEYERTYGKERLQSAEEVWQIDTAHRAPTTGGPGGGRGTDAVSGGTDAGKHGSGSTATAAGAARSGDVAAVGTARNGDVAAVGTATNGDAVATAAAAPSGKGANPGKELAKARRRVARLEELMEQCDAKKAELEARMAAPDTASDYVKLAELQQELEEVTRAADAYLEEWTELSERLERET